MEVRSNRMDFVVGLPRALSGQGAIGVFIDILTKYVNFILFKITDTMEKLAESMCEK